MPYLYYISSSLINLAKDDFPISVFVFIQILFTITFYEALARLQYTDLINPALNSVGKSSMLFI